MCILPCMEEGLIAAAQEWEYAWLFNLQVHNMNTVFPLTILGYFARNFPVILSCQPLFVCRLIDLVVIDGVKGFSLWHQTRKVVFPLTSRGKIVYLYFCKKTICMFSTLCHVLPLTLPGFCLAFALPLSCLRVAFGLPLLWQVCIALHYKER